jgi:hypothetical protein
MNKFPKKKGKENKINKTKDGKKHVKLVMRGATSCNRPLTNSRMWFLLRHHRHHPNFLLGVLKVLCGSSHVGLIAFSLAIVEIQVHPSISEKE